MKYKFNWNYKSSLGGPWLKGAVVEFSETQAEAIQKDSPGVLSASKAPFKENRMQAEAEFERKSVSHKKEEPITAETFKAVVNKRK